RPLHGTGALPCTAIGSAAATKRSLPKRVACTLRQNGRRATRLALLPLPVGMPLVAEAGSVEDAAFRDDNDGPVGELHCQPCPQPFLDRLVVEDRDGLGTVLDV